MNPQASFSSGSHGLATSVDELWPPLEFQQSDFQPDGPMASLRIELELPASGATVDCAKALADVLHSLNDQEVALGGKGLVMDQQVPQLAGGKLSLLLRPMEVLGSFDRLRQLAETLSAAVSVESQGQASHSPSDQNELANAEFMDHVKGCLWQTGDRSNCGMTPPNLGLRVSAHVVAA